MRCLLRYVLPHLRNIMLYYVNIMIIFISGKYRKKNKILIIHYYTIDDLFIHGHETPNIWKVMVEWEKLLRKCHSRLYTYANKLAATVSVVALYSARKTASRRCEQFKLLPV